MHIYSAIIVFAILVIIWAISLLCFLVVYSLDVFIWKMLLFQHLVTHYRGVVKAKLSGRSGVSDRMIKRILDIAL